jgi:UDP-3-O-[3-hydroxymyristoyl] glucosamine N-acyltransferase
MDKFELTRNTKTIPGVGTVRQIRALVDIYAHNVKKGDLGGFLRFPSNLSQSGDSWVADDAVIGGTESIVAQNALVCDSALVKDSYIGRDTIISGNARVIGSSLVGTGILIGENANLKKVDINGKAITINGHAQVERLTITIQAYHISIGEHARITNTNKNLVIAGHTIQIEGNAHLDNCSFISGSLMTLSNDCVLKDGVQLNGKNIKVSGASSIEGNIAVGHDVELTDCVRVYNPLTLVEKIGYLTLNGDIAGTPQRFNLSY